MEFLEPIGLVDDTLNEKGKLLYNILEKKQHDKNNSFDQFLDELHLTETNYITTIKSELLAKLSGKEH